MKGVPVRIAMGPRDMENGTVEIARRDTLEKNYIPFEEAPDHVEGLMKDIQQNLYDKALKFREANTRKADSWDEFKALIKNDGGFIFAHWDGTPETEEAIKEKTKATIRCIPLNNELEEGKCILTGKPSKQRVIFAKAY
jgi:prolyl-tRNA synthetase